MGKNVNNTTVIKTGKDFCQVWSNTNQNVQPN